MNRFPLSFSDTLRAAKSLRRWCYLLLALAVVAYTGMVSSSNERARESVDLSMDGSRVVYGLTTVVSHLRFGSPLYSYYTPVLDIFWTKKTMSWAAVDGLIGKAWTIDPRSLTPAQLHIGFGELDYDDKGVILWYWAAFSLFGPHLLSIYLLYFFMLGFSLLVFWLSFRDDDAALALLPLYALVHQALAAYVLAGNTAIMGTLLTTRPFAMLAALPTLHLALLMLRRRSHSPWLLAGALAQIGFLFLIIGVRSSAETQLLLLFLVAAFALAQWKFREAISLGDFRRGLFSHGFGWVPACLLACMACAATAYSVAVPAEVRAKALSGHLMWHNVLAGFVLDKGLEDDLFQYAKAFKPYDKPPEHDELAYIATVGYFKSVLHQDIADLVMGPPDKRNNNLYEACARTLFFSELRRRPKEIAHLFIVTKTRNLYLLLLTLLTQIRSNNALIAAAAIGFMSGAAWLRGLKVIAPLILAGFAVSSLSVYLFVPAFHIMFDYASYFYLGFLSIIATAGALGAVAVRYAIRPMRPVAQS